MGRIYTSESEPVDLCRTHFPRNEERARREFGNLGDGPDGRGNCFAYDADHPPYADDDYRCAVCGVSLGDGDE